MVKVSPLTAPAIVLVKVGLGEPYGREALLTVTVSPKAPDAWVMVSVPGFTVML